jgi:hypothetical protein
MGVFDMKRFIHIIAGLWISGVFFSYSFAFQEGRFNYLVPSLQGYSKYYEGFDDADHNGTKESYLICYVNDYDDKIFKFTKRKGGAVWCWIRLHRKQKVSDLKNNYAIVKSTPDGPFDRLLNIEEEIIVPVWVK